MYALIFKSRKPEAKQFRHWVTAEVLPRLRVNGSYTVAQPSKLLSSRKHNRLTPERLLDIMKDVVLIEDQGIRMRLLRKLGL